MNKERERMLMEYELVLRSARNRLFHFIHAVNLQYVANWHHKLIADKIDKFLKDDKQSKMMVFVPPQHGKLLPADTLIFTPTGWKNHGDLRAGDYVFAPSGKPVMVTANSGIYEWNVDNVVFQDGKNLLSAKEHLWKVKIELDDHKGRREMILETQEILKKKNRRSPAIDSNSALEMPEADLLIDPYILGCWLGDGDKTYAALTVGKEDIEHFSKLGRIREVRPGIYTVNIDSIRGKLREEGLLKNKHIPIKYLLSSIEQRTRLLQGLMDTDGHCGTRGDCEFTQKSGRLAADVYTLLRSLGYKARIKDYDSTIYGRVVGRRTRIMFVPNRDDTIFSLPRKADRIKNKIKSDRNDKNKLFIKSIEPFGVVHGNCIEVEGGMYLAGVDLIPTHNSQITSRSLPAYLLGKNPACKIAIASYSSDLAGRFNSNAQDIMSSDAYKAIFPNTVLIRKTLEECETAEGGGIKAVGVTGPLTGNTVDVAIIDDPVKDDIEASSTTYRERVWQWYLSVIETRLHNKSKVILILTRWHEEDLAGRLLNMQPDNWQVISIPAIREDMDNPDDPRAIGEPLWPERHSLERLNDLRAMSEVTFSSLYQQRPAPAEGNKVKRAWWTYCDEKELPGGISWDIWIDGAYTKQTENDPTGLMVAGHHKPTNVLYIKNAHDARLEMPELLKFIDEYAFLHGIGPKSSVFLEPKASGKSLKQMLVSSTTLNAIEIANHLVSEGKEARIQTASPKIAAGRVCLVKGAWNDRFVTQICTFPNSAHDEYVDLIGYACYYYFDQQGRRKGVTYRDFEEFIN